MKSRFTIFIGAFLVHLLFLPFAARANKDRIYTSQKAGITIRYIAPDNPGTQALVDSVLQEIVNRLKRSRSNLDILVFVNNGRLCFTEGYCSSFFSVGIDTLRDIDDHFIETFYYRQSQYDSRKFPLDINATDKKAGNEVGIKIFYDVDFRSAGPDWNDLIRVVTYAAKNPAIIDGNQKRDTVRYHENDWYVSLMTVDTALINQILADTTHAVEKPFRPGRATPDGRTISWQWMLYGLVVIVGLFLIFRYWKPWKRWSPGE